MDGSLAASVNTGDGFLTNDQYHVRVIARGTSHEVGKLEYGMVRALAFHMPCLARDHVPGGKGRSLPTTKPAHTGEPP